MHVAFITSIVPDGNPSSGFEIANRAIIDGLRALGHRVSVLGMKLPRQMKIDDPDTQVLGIRNLENAGAGKAEKLIWLAQSLIHGLPFSSGKLRPFSPNTPPSWRNLKAKLDVLQPLDGLILNSYQMAAAFPALRRHPYIYLSHNVEHVTSAENAAATPGTLERRLHARDARLLKRLEAELCAGARHVWFLSEDDRKGHEAGAGQSTVLPLVLPKSGGVRNAGPPQDKTFDAGLIGTWTWKANATGLRWFLDTVVPSLDESITIAVAGSVPAGIAETCPRVCFPGRVDDAADFLGSVRVVPLVSRGGTGVQLKTIEAFQSGLACVATHSSVRGIDGIPANCRVADDPSGYARELQELVLLSRSGRLPVTDGSNFYLSQRKALESALKTGMCVFSS